MEAIFITLPEAAKLLAMGQRQLREVLDRDPELAQEVTIITGKRSRRIDVERLKANRHRFRAAPGTGFSEPAHLRAAPLKISSCF